MFTNLIEALVVLAILYAALPFFPEAGMIMVEETEGTDVSTSPQGRVYCKDPRREGVCPSICVCIVVVN
jgi:hypothetical protein